MTLFEELATQALHRDALGRFDISRARATLTDMLAAVGRTPQFTTYTRHDVTHVDAMLNLAEQLLEPACREAMTVADGLLVTLSCFLHDVGMLVTADEFAGRSGTHFAAFEAEALEDSSDDGINLRYRLAQFEPAQREEFLYEEFVRRNHARRVGAWIRGVPKFDELGQAQAAAGLVTDVLRDLSTVIREDLAKLVESHHLDNLDDGDRYKSRRAYSGEVADIANVQFVALLLRSADLLHMTKDRTPAVQFRLSSPKDPVGQREWRKQEAIRAVIPRQLGDNKFVLEVHALFDDPEGYFALNDFLDYCQSQLEKTRKWADSSARSSEYPFSWGEFDRSSIEATGFEPKHFSFTLDQSRVLDLLTGHTLYNDASVALRELTQNAIDAVKLAKLKDQWTALPDCNEDIRITYDAETRRFTILDSGVGMNLADLERHFLRVGASSYQTEEFRDTYPDFTSISRFGIGALSSFMIADEMQVLTISKSDNTLRELVLRSVHGNYLIKDASPEEVQKFPASGTQISFTIRPSIDLPALADVLESWIVVPGVEIRFQDGAGNTCTIGYPSAQAALEKKLIAYGSRTGQQVEVFNHHEGDFTVAIARVWDETFREWNVVQRDEENSSGIRVAGDERLPLEGEIVASGVCIQGVRVTPDIPGLRRSPWLIINCVGKDAPSTNVARTSIEQGLQRDALIDVTYKALLSHVLEQRSGLADRVSHYYSSTELAFLYEDFAGRNNILSRSLMSSATADLALTPVEISGEHRPLSVNQLSDGFSVIVGPAADDAVRFVEWLPGEVGILETLKRGKIVTEDVDEARPLIAGSAPLRAFGGILWQHFEPTSAKLLGADTALWLELEKDEHRWQDAYKDSVVLAARNRILRLMLDDPDYGRLYFSHPVSLRTGTPSFTVPSFAFEMGDYDVIEIDSRLFVTSGSYLTSEWRVLQQGAEEGLSPDAVGRLQGFLAVLVERREYNSRRLAERLSLIREYFLEASIPESVADRVLALWDTEAKVWSSANVWRRRAATDT